MTCFFLLFFTTRISLNDKVVNMANSNHSELIPFIINAILGSLLILNISVLIPNNKILNYYGKNTLILLGLNGIFYHFFNKQISNFTLIYTENSWASITENCLIYSILAMLICFPFVYFLNKYLPQLFGKPVFDGNK